MDLVTKGPGIVTAVNGGSAGHVALIEAGLHGGLGVQWLCFVSMVEMS